MSTGGPSPCRICGSYHCSGPSYVQPTWDHLPPKPPEPTPEQLGWIPVEEGLPVENRLVWLLDQYDNVALGFGWSPNPGVWEYEQYYEKTRPVWDVTHWQPIQKPQAPK